MVSHMRIRSKDVDMWLQHNKVTNLRIAAKELNGVVLKPGETFGATCFYNYLDLQIRNDTNEDFQTEGTIFISASSCGLSCYLILHIQEG